jgi:putative methionine-R-sulfoxide reductase with GAF domain
MTAKTTSTPDKIRPIHHREYGTLLAAARDATDPSRDAAMQRLCDLLWNAFGDPGEHRPSRGMSWVGFYLHGPAPDQMTLAVRRDKPACSPIGLHGMCGRCWQTRRPVIIDDVATLGTNYIACDPKDRSELVLPCLDAAGACWGVLDIDSWDRRAFDENDAAGCWALLVAAGLAHGDQPPPLRL